MKTLRSLIVVALLLAMPAAVFAALVEVDMVADGGSTATETVVGKVQAWNDADNLYVQYFPQPPWYLRLTHVEVATSWEAIPQKNGNPIPGQFTYGDGAGPHAIPLQDIEGYTGPGDKLYIAAHAEVCKDVGSIVANLPDFVKMDVSLPDPATHIDVLVYDGGILAGSYSAYCVELDLPILEPYTYENVAVSTNGHGPLVMQKVNYVLNQDYIGQGYENSEIQGALWRLFGYSQQDLVDYFSLQSPDDYPQPPPDLAKVEEIVADAEANGAGFEPECGDYIGIKLDPPDYVKPDGTVINLQKLLIKILLECQCETAWGAIKENGEDPNEPNDGPKDHDDSYAYDFPGKNWAHFFTYVVPRPAPPRMSLDSSVTTTWGSIKNR